MDIYRAEELDVISADVTPWLLKDPAVDLCCYFLTSMD